MTVGPTFEITCLSHSVDNMTDWVIEQWYLDHICKLDGATPWPTLPALSNHAKGFSDKKHKHVVKPTKSLWNNRLSPWCRPPLWPSGQSSWLQNGDALCFLWGTNWIYICYVEEGRPPLWSSGQSSWLYNGDVLCFLWGTNWIYICYVEVGRPPLWSNGQSSWLHNGDVLCFLWGTNWIYICYVEESRPPLWSSGQSYWLHNGDVLWFLWATKWIYMLCRMEVGRLCGLVVRVTGYTTEM
jgi:hypothetical protein